MPQPKRSCDLCRAFGDGKLLDEVIDGRTVHGRWAWMCKDHHKVIGVGFGTGKGQRFVYDEAVQMYKKVEG